MQDVSACNVRAPHEPATEAQRSGCSSTSSASNQISSSTGCSTARTEGRPSVLRFDPLAQDLGGTPELVARELDRHEGRWTVDAPGKGGDIDADARAPGRH